MSLESICKQDPTWWKSFQTIQDTIQDVEIGLYKIMVVIPYNLYWNVSLISYPILWFWHRIMDQFRRKCWIFRQIKERKWKKLKTSLTYFNDISCIKTCSKIEFQSWDVLKLTHCKNYFMFLITFWITVFFVKVFESALSLLKIGSN